MLVIGPCHPTQTYGRLRWQKKIATTHKHHFKKADESRESTDSDKLLKVRKRDASSHVLGPDVI